MCCRGYFIAIELKSDPKTDLEPRQQYEADLILKAEGIVLKAHPLNWPDILLMLSAFAEGLMTHAALALRS